MPKPAVRTYSTQARIAGELLGQMIRNARIERRMSKTELAERAGVSRGLLNRAEKGDLSVSLGAVFELAVIVGIPLFGGDERFLKGALDSERYKGGLLPSSVHRSPPEIDDDF